MRSHSLTKLFAITLVTVSLVACGGGGGTPSSDGGTSGTSSGTELSMIGTWKSVCMYIGGSDPYIIAIINYFGGGVSTDTVKWYSDPACASATGLEKLYMNTYSFGNGVTASGMSGVELDATVNSWELRQDGFIVSSGVNVPTQYDIVAIEGDRLYHSGLSRAIAGPITDPANRPMTFDLDNYYTRQ